jgi:hypothetical protein
MGKAKGKAGANGKAPDPAQKQPSNRHYPPELASHLAPYQFPPGVSGNPGGRPKGRSITAYLNEMLERTEIEGVDIPAGSCGAEALALVFFREAVAGKFPFAKEILDRTEGKVPDRYAGHDGGPLIDLRKLTDEELDTLAGIYKKLVPPDPIDVTGSADDPEN